MPNTIDQGQMMPQSTWQIDTQMAVLQKTTGTRLPQWLFYCGFRKMLQSMI